MTAGEAAPGECRAAAATSQEAMAAASDGAPIFASAAA